jgi:hypothetical protein
MKRVNIITVLLVSGIGFFMHTASMQAQEKIERQVEVVKPYEPAVSDAFKISLLPRITDTVRVLPDFQYSIFPTPITSDFTIEPITPARMSSESLLKLYNSHLRMGVGSYISPFAELSMNTVRNKDYTAGIWLKHHSSHDAMKLENDLKTFPAFSDNEALAYGTRFFGKTALAADIGLKSNGFHYYGVNPETLIEFDKKSIRQNFLNFHTGLKMYSFDTDSSRLNYDVSVKYNYFKDRDNTAENGIKIDIGMHKFLRNEIVGADISLDYYTNTAYQDSFNTVLKLNPWITKSTKDWHVYAGFVLAHDKFGENARAYFFPKATLQFNVVENYLIPYVGVDGNLDVNNYSTTAYNNFFIMPGLFVRNTNNKLNLYGGIKGNLGTYTSFNIKAGYSVFEDMHFFVNDTINDLRNQFFVIYDDVERINYYGEIATRAFPGLDVMMKANIFKYTLNIEEKAWHMPNYDLTISARYSLRDKIIVSTDVFAIGKRFAKSYEPSVEMIELKNIVDFNLGVEYRYTKLLSGFVRFNNVGAARYYKWNQYPTHRFNLVAGFTYSL